jgi:hypothetical protein
VLAKSVTAWTNLIGRIYCKFGWISSSHRN